MESCAAPMALKWEERFHPSAQLCGLQWQLRDKEVIYKKAELILCVSNLFPFSCASPKSPLLQKLILGGTFVRAQKALSLGGSQDNECHKLFLKAWLFVKANICDLHLKGLWMILLNRAVMLCLKEIRRGNFPFQCCCYPIARALLFNGSQSGSLLGSLPWAPGSGARYHCQARDFSPVTTLPKRLKGLKGSSAGDLVKHNVP